MHRLSALPALLLLCAPGCALEEDPVEQVEQEVNWAQGKNFGATMLNTDGGFGWANVHSHPNDTFSATITVQLTHLSPNTTYTLQRAPEVGSPQIIRDPAADADGICLRAAGVAPWVGVASFLGFGVSMTTNAAGNGVARFDFAAPMIPSGRAFDVMFEAIGADGTSIRSDCFTVTPQ